MKYFFAFGTRPEVIKMAPVIKEAQRRGHEVITCLSGQHKEMVTPFLEFFEIQVDHNLEIMKDKQTLESITSSALEGFCQALEKFKPDMVFVQGDTTTTFAGALAAFYKKIPVAHIEAGLRTDERYSPFPEEINRRMVGQIAQYHFAPTAQAAENLYRDGIRENVFVTGNTSIDALDFTLEKISQKSVQHEGDKRIILVTSHRRENLGDAQIEIFSALEDLHDKFSDIEIIFPVHLNPLVQKAAKDSLSHLPRVKLVVPLDYVEFVKMMKRSTLILSDSGGVQEEAPHLGKPVLVLRETTERPEGVESGTSFLVGSDAKKIVDLASRLLTDKGFYQQVSSAQNPYGHGRSAQKIFDHLAPKASLKRQKETFF